MRGDSAEAIRAEIVRRRHMGPRERYPAALRERVIAFARARQGAGDELSQLTDALGLGRNTLGRWLAETSGFRRVEVIDPQPPTPAPLVVHGPNGLRIEVRDVGALADLLRRLG